MARGLNKLHTLSRTCFGDVNAMERVERHPDLLLDDPQQS